MLAWLRLCLHHNYLKQIMLIIRLGVESVYPTVIEFDYFVSL